MCRHLRQRDRAEASSCRERTHARTRPWRAVRRKEGRRELRLAGGFFVGGFSPSGLLDIYRERGGSSSLHGSLISGARRQRAAKKGTRVRERDKGIDSTHPHIYTLERRVSRPCKQNPRREGALELLLLSAQHIMSGVGFMTAVKTFGPAGRRRRRCEKQQRVLELPGYTCHQHQQQQQPQPDVVPSWDAAPPITPPAAFLPPGYKKGFIPGEDGGSEQPARKSLGERGI